MKPPTWSGGAACWQPLYEQQWGSCVFTGGSWCLSAVQTDGTTHINWARTRCPSPGQLCPLQHFTVSPFFLFTFYPSHQLRDWTATVSWWKPCTMGPVLTTPPPTGVQYGSQFQSITHQHWLSLSSGSASFVIFLATKGTLYWWRHHRSLLLVDPRSDPFIASS